MTDGRRWTLRLFGLVANYRSPWRRFALSASRNAPLRRSRRGRKRVTPCPYVSAACLWGGGAVSAADDRENGHGAPLLDELAAKPGKTEAPRGRARSTNSRDLNS